MMGLDRWCDESELGATTGEESLTHRCVVTEKAAQGGMPRQSVLSSVANSKASNKKGACQSYPRPGWTPRPRTSRVSRIFSDAQGFAYRMANQGSRQSS